MEVKLLKQCYQVSDNVSSSIAPGGVKYCLESLAGYTNETVLSGFSSISQGGVTHSLESLGGYTAETVL